MTPAGKEEDHYTRVFHELMEPLLRLDLNGTQFRIVLWVIRNTYGWDGRKFAPFSWGRIADDLAADRSRVSREGRALLDSGYLQARGDIQTQDREIGVGKHRIMEHGGVRKRTGGCENAPVRVRHAGGGENARVFPIPQENKERTPPLPAPKNGFGPEQLLELWNQTADARLPRARELSPERRRFALARLKDHPEAAFWGDVLARVNSSAFLTGQNDRGWVADFDFILNPNKLPRIIEGKYGNGNGPKPAAEDGHAKMAAWKKRTEAA